MGLDIRHLKLLLAVAEQGSLTKAAITLHLTQSALSHQLKEAERIVQTPLCAREARRMTLTPAGKRLLATARRVIAEMELAEREVREHGKDPAGVIRIATECYTCYHWLPTTIETFAAKFPQVDVRIVVEATRNPIPALLDREIDLGIVSERTRERRLELYPVFEDELVAVVSPGHRLAKRPVVLASDLAEENLLTYAAAREQLDIFKKVLWPAGLAPKKWIPMELTEAIVEMVAAGRGVGVLARWAAEPQIKSGALIARKVTQRGLPRVWSAAIQKRKGRPDYLVEFIRALAARHRVHFRRLAAAS